MVARVANGNKIFERILVSQSRLFWYCGNDGLSTARARGSDYNWHLLCCSNGYLIRYDRVAENRFQ